MKKGDGIEENNTKAGSSNISTFFPSNVRTILSNLRRFFPRLQSLRIEFKPIDWEDFWNDENFDYSDGETAEQISSAEDDRAWRALMAKTYKLPAQNQQPCIKALEIQALMPKEVSTFSNRAFYDFLGMLERFTLSIYGNHNGARWNINTIHGHPAFLSKLDKIFFDHLQNVTYFDLKADWTGPIGLEGLRHARLALRGDQMPLLMYLYLKYIFVCPELLDFLVWHAGTLESVSFSDWYGRTSDRGPTEHSTIWYALFIAFSDAEPRKLSQFEILPVNVPYHMPPCQIPPPQPSRAEEVRLLLEENPKRRLFPYAVLDDKYGMLLEDEYENQASFFKGDDQKSWERLMEIVEGNRGAGVS